MDRAVADIDETLSLSIETRRRHQEVCHFFLIESGYVQVGHHLAGSIWTSILGQHQSSDKFLC